MEKKSHTGLEQHLCHVKLLIALQNLFLLKLFGIGNYLTLIYLSTGSEYGLISA